MLDKITSELHSGKKHLISYSSNKTGIKVRCSTA